MVNDNFSSFFLFYSLESFKLRSSIKNKKIESSIHVRDYIICTTFEMNENRIPEHHESINISSKRCRHAIVGSRSQGTFERSPAREFAHVGCRKSLLRICPPPTAFAAIILPTSSPLPPSLLSTSLSSSSVSLPLTICPLSRHHPRSLPSLSFLFPLRLFFLSFLPRSLPLRGCFSNQSARPRSRRDETQDASRRVAQRRATSTQQA